MNLRFPTPFDMGRFLAFAVLTLLVAWLAGTGRVAYTFTMLLIAAALVYRFSISSTTRS